jgi:hypothetical protein
MQLKYTAPWRLVVCTTWLNMVYARPGNGRPCDALHTLSIEQRAVSLYRP